MDKTLHARLKATAQPELLSADVFHPARALACDHVAETGGCFWCQRTLAGKRQLDLYGAGAPCQPFSQMGRKAGWKDPRARVLRRDAGPHGVLRPKSLLSFKGSISLGRPADPLLEAQQLYIRERAVPAVQKEQARSS